MSSPEHIVALPLGHTASPPFHHIPGVSNFRDIGGWPITSTSHVRKNIIFRGSDTTRITPAGIEALLALNVKRDFDLRSKTQIEKLGCKDLSEYGINRVWSPVFADGEGEEEVKRRYEMYASEDVHDIVAAFIEILTSGASVMRTVVQHLLTTVDTSVPLPALFIHCTTGNNRTGVFVALLLLLLHVPTRYIVQEYTLSEIGLAPTRHINVERLLKKGAFKEYGEVEARKKCERMVAARKESMEALLNEAERRWDGANGYFLEVVGLTRDELRRVRELLTAEGRGEWVEETL